MFSSLWSLLHALVILDVGITRRVGVPLVDALPGTDAAITSPQTAAPMNRWFGNRRGRTARGNQKGYYSYFQHRLTS
jgi:hypothetical protein